MHQIQAWTARLFTLHSQIKFGTSLLLVAMLVLAFTLLRGLNEMLSIATWNAHAYQVTDRLYAIDKKLFDDFAGGKGRAVTAEIIADDLSALQKLSGNEEHLEQLQAQLKTWHNNPEDTTAKMRGQVKEMLRTQTQLVAQKQTDAEQLNQRMLLTAIAISLLTGTLALVFSRRLSERINEPVQQMLLAMERLTLGDLAPHVEDKSHDEFGLLANSFNRMALQLSERQNATLVRNRELDELYYFNTMLQTSESETEIHRALLQKVRALNLSQALVLDWETQTSSMTVVATLYPLPETRPDGSAISYQIPLCRVVRSGREIVLPDLSEDLICTDCHFGQQRGSAYCVPIISGGKPVGALHLVSPQLDYWIIERQKFIKALVDQAASAINNLRLMDQLRGRALMDEQTQVHNRRYLDDYLRKQIAAADRQRRPLCVMMLDIDYFKRFNDTYGHEAGDIVLRQFAQAIKGALREGELVARYGGEEFTVIMHGNAREALTLAERLRRTVAALSFKQFTNNGEEVRISMSIGIAEFPSSGHTLEEVLKAADLALYTAKDSGRNCVKVATKTLLAVRAAMQ